jgi:hypothetical protein
VHVTRHIGYVVVTPQEDRCAASSELFS